jgi:excinuclease UvrABC helicase subunit UvrB
VGYKFERHHWLIKRGAVPKNSFELIDVLINVVPVHSSCHQEFGQTREFKHKCLVYVLTISGAEDILEWYNSVSIKTNLIKKDSTGEL